MNNNQIKKTTKKRNRKSKSFYAIIYTKNKQCGTYLIVDSWAKCQKLITGNAHVYRKFKSKVEAETWCKTASENLKKLDEEYLVDDILNNPWRNYFNFYSTKNWKY